MAPQNLAAIIGIACCMTVLFFSIATGDEAREQAVDRTQVPKAMGVADKNACNHEFGVALDVGHTPERPGTLTARGRTEYEFNLHLAESIRSVLIQRGYKNLYLIKMIGGSETLTQRDIKANDLNANLFISLHHDSVKSSYLKTWMVDGKQQQYNDDFSGYSLFVSKKIQIGNMLLLSPPCCPTSCWPAISILRFTMRPRKGANCWTKIAGYIGKMTLSF